MATYKWRDAKVALDEQEWAGIGNIKSMYAPLRLLVNRFKKAYQLKHGGRQPKLDVAVSYIMIYGADKVAVQCDLWEAEAAEAQPLN